MPLVCLRSAALSKKVLNALQLTPAFFAEYASVDHALDEMLNFMDVLEERSNDLFAKMQELLADSRQIREEMQAAKEHADDDNDDGHEQPTVS